MTYQDFLNKIRYWDNKCARWMMGHFYFIFFEIVLVIIFFLFLINAFHTLDTISEIATTESVQLLAASQAKILHLIMFLLILNSFWMLFMFNGMERIRIILKEISYNLSRRRQGEKKDNE